MQRSDLNIPVIYFHSVGVKNPQWVNNFLTLDLSFFEDQLKYFSRHFRCISLSEFFDIRLGLLDPVKNPIVITFDDGYLDNWVWAFPMLKKYSVKATIFVSPEFVDPRPVVRPNLEDVWEGRAGHNEIAQWGFLSWDEMRLMERSGLVDIQSHTFTHTKYFVSDKLTGFHHPGGDIIYPTGNIYPERRPYYISDQGFEKLLPYGFPLFEERSAVIARKVEINPDFISQCILKFKEYDFAKYRFEPAYSLITGLYEKFRSNKLIIVSTESEEDYLARVRNEICESKRIIEKELDKKVEFLCWPHGDNNEFLHQIALEAGYLMTTKGKAKGVKESDITRIPERLGVDFSTWRKKQKAIFKLKAFSGEIPYDILLNTFRRLRNKTLTKNGSMTQRYSGTMA